MSLSSNLVGCDASLAGLPARAPAEMVSTEHEAIDGVANLVVIQEAVTVYVHPDTVVHRLAPTWTITGGDLASPNGLIPLRRKKSDGSGALARAGVEAAFDLARAEVWPLAHEVGADVSPNRSSDSGTVTALIVDEHPLERRGLAAILREEIGVADICQADSAAMGLTLAREKRPELAIVDVHLAASIPARELCAQLRSVLAEARIVLLTASDRVSEIRDCLMAGANGCLLKDTPERDLAESIQAVLKGKTVIDTNVAHELACTLSADGMSVWLSSREREVLDLLAEGCANRQIADRLILSETTVKGYISKLFEKVRASSRLEVVAQARRVGLL
jgi:DNA-binding NarL/FixJ family response regulator